jgi:quinohemoprotein amine dehydrogenase beta subunit
VKTFFAFDVTPDGAELIVHEIPVKRSMSEYTVLDTRFAVFRTGDGLDARPVRSFPAPRAVSSVLMRKDGRSFYALGFDLYEFDHRTGRQLGERGVRNWPHLNRSIPDLLAVRPISEPTGIFTLPMFSMVSPAGDGGEPVPTSTIMSLDLHSGDLQYRDVAGEAVALYSTAKSPTKAELYGVFNDLVKFDAQSMTVVGRVPLDHTYYAVLVSTDGQEVYAAGAGCDVTIFDAGTLTRKANIRMPDCGDQSATSPRIVRR